MELCEFGTEHDYSWSEIIDPIGENILTKQNATNYIEKYVNHLVVLFGKTKKDAIKHACSNLALGISYEYNEKEKNRLYELFQFPLVTKKE